MKTRLPRQIYFHVHVIITVHVSRIISFTPLSPQLCGSDTAGARPVTSREKAQKPSEKKKYQQQEQHLAANKAPR